MARIGPDATHSKVSPSFEGLRKVNLKANGLLTVQVTSKLMKSVRFRLYLAFLCDIFGMTNQLNKKLQGHQVYVHKWEHYIFPYGEGRAAGTLQRLVEEDQ